jgi:hypothetical protein
VSQAPFQQFCGWSYHLLRIKHSFSCQEEKAVKAMQEFTHFKTAAQGLRIMPVTQWIPPLKTRL